VSGPTKQCTAPATRSPNADYQLSTLGPHRAKVDAAIAAETARRKKDPNIAKRGRKPQNSGWDGSISPVEHWVKERLKDPSSYEHVRTSDPAPDGPYWKVVTVYRAKNSFNATITETRTLWLQGDDVIKAQ
jgi:hypothetical protein